MDNSADNKKILVCLDSLTVFSNIKNDSIIINFKKLVLALEDNKPLEVIERWSDFLAAFIQKNNEKSFYAYITKLICTDENPFTLACENGSFNEHSILASLAENDLKKLYIIACFPFHTLSVYFEDILFKEGFKNSVDFIKGAGAEIETESNSFFNIKNLALHIKEKGAGIFASSKFFYWGKNAPEPAANPDTIRVSDLSLYEDKRQTVYDNTERFLKGSGNNMLLYGDRGTGKSATVKAVCNEFSALRLIEVRKQDLGALPDILKLLCNRGLYFILFIDDLSFESQSDSFSMLKAVLEGGIETKPKNVVIYATSNRRHLIKESTRDRPDTSALADSKENGDMRAFDTMQEQLSLSDRFGITLVFTAPSQGEYLKIAEFLAEQKGLLDKNTDRKDFYDKAIMWERWFNGRSPRTARQFVDWLQGGNSFPWGD